MKTNILEQIKKGARVACKFADKHSPEILVGCGIVGFISTTILVAKESPIAKEKIEDLHIDLAKEEKELSPIDKIKEWLSDFVKSKESSDKKGGKKK